MNIRIKLRSFFVDFFFFLISFACFFLEDSPRNLPYIGYVLIPLSFYMLFKVRKNRFLMYLFMVIVMVNISVGINDFVRMGEGISEWQSRGLRVSEYNMQSAKAMLLFTVVLNFFINGKVCNVERVKYEVASLRRENKVIAYGAFVLLCGILIFAIIDELPKHLNQSYDSVGNPLYEYSVLLFVISWMYGANIKKLDILYVIYCIAFSTVFLIMGDRSSITMYLLFYIVVYYKGKLNLGRVLGLGTCGIVFMNIIAVMRDGIYSISRIVENIVQRGLYIDTASWAYYGGVACVGVSDASGKRWKLLISFFKSLVGIRDQYANLTQFARSYSPTFYNADGGIIPTYILAISGYFGVIVVAIIIGILIRNLFIDVFDYKLFFKFLMIVFAIRWYVYTPLNLFRSVFIIGGITYFLFIFADSLLKQKNK